MVELGCRLHRKDGLFVQPHAAKRPGAQGASPPRLCPCAAAGLCGAPVPLYRVCAVLGGGRVRRPAGGRRMLAGCSIPGRRSRITATAPAAHPLPHQPAGPPFVQSGAFKGVRCIQPGRSLHRKDGLFVQPHAAKRPGAQGASPPRLCPCAAAGLCGAPVPPYRVRVVPGSPACRAAADLGPCLDHSRRRSGPLRIPPRARAPAGPRPPPP